MDNTNQNNTNNDEESKAAAVASEEIADNSELLELSNRTDISDIPDQELLSPDQIYEQRAKMEEKFQRESDGTMVQELLQPCKMSALNSPPLTITRKEAAHQASVEEYVNRKVQERAKAMNIDTEEERASMEKRYKEEQRKSQAQPVRQSTMAIFEHPPNLPMDNDDSEVGLSDGSNFFDVSDHDVLSEPSSITPAQIQEQRAKSQAKMGSTRDGSSSLSSRSGTTSKPGAVRVSMSGAFADLDEQSSPKKTRNSLKSSLRTVGEHLAVEAKLVDDAENSEFFKARLEEDREEYRNQLREEFEEEEKQKSEKLVYATATRDDPWTNLWSHKWKVLAGLLVVTGGITAALLVALAPEPTPDPTLAPTDLPLFYDPPTAEECAAISRGETLQGQEDMIVELLDVEVDVSLESEDDDISTLLPSLEAAMKRRLVPALSDCPFVEDRRLLRSRELESTETKKNSKYCVANTNLELEERVGVSCSAASQKPCRRIVMKLELFLKGHEYVSELMTLVYDLRKDRSVLQTLGLGSPYTVIDFVAINSGTPIEEVPLFYDPPSPQDCEDISQGLAIAGQEDMLVKLLDVEVDVTLNNETQLDLIVSLLPSLEDVMKERLVPALSHCPFQEGNEDRRLLEYSENPKYVVANTNLQLQDRPGVACSEGSPQPCHRIVMRLELFLKGHEYISTLMNLVYDLRKDRPVVETLGLGSPYSAIDFVAINSGTTRATIAPTDAGDGIVETQNFGQ